MTKKLPKFKNLDEEAKFWDTHSVTDYGKVISPKKMDIKSPLKMTFTVRLESKTVNELDNIAKEKGIGPRTLARMWLLEKLKEEYQTA